MAIRFDQILLEDELWRATALGKWDIFKLLHKDSIADGYVPIESEPERRVGNLFDSTAESHKMPSDKSSFRKQVSTCQLVSWKYNTTQHLLHM